MLWVWWFSGCLQPQDQTLADRLLSSSTRWWMKPSHCVHRHKLRSPTFPQSSRPVTDDWPSLLSIKHPGFLSRSHESGARQQKTGLSHKPLTAEAQMSSKPLMSRLPHFRGAQLINIQKWMQVLVYKDNFVRVCIVTLKDAKSLFLKSLRYNCCTVTLNVIFITTILSHKHVGPLCASIHGVYVRTGLWWLA